MLLRDGSLIVSNHAQIRLFEKNIKNEVVKQLIKDGELIENYKDDFPCPSQLILGQYQGDHLHLVIGICEDHVRLITVYSPDESKWVNYRVRRGEIDEA